MEIFHVAGGGSNLKTLRLLDRKVNLLVSAWTYQTRETEFKSHAALIREKANLLLVDSGFLGAANQGNLDWINQQERVVEIADLLGADRVAMLDIPMSPEILSSIGYVKDHKPDFAKALEVTYRNAEAMVRLPSRATKGFVNQGWTIEHREECHKTMLSLGADKAADWWGMGSVAKRTPETGLYEHGEWCRENIRGHLHCFGIAKAPWVRRLKEMGFDSCDSASASTATRFASVLANGTQVPIVPRDGPNLRRNTRMHELLYWYNMEAIEYEVNRSDVTKSNRKQGPTQGRFAI